MEERLKALREGLSAGDFIILCTQPKRGRFEQEINLELFAEREGKRKHLLYAKIFKGRDYYRDWVELFGISGEVFSSPYFGSELESTVLDFFSELTGRLFVEYYEDMETVKELSAGVPPALSRLGFELAKRGFTWFKDWYFPEGLMEGGHKLQAEKPSDPDRMKKHLKALEEEVSLFLQGERPEHLKSGIADRFKILRSLWTKTSR
jgi:hypothetical protein